MSGPSVSVIPRLQLADLGDQLSSVTNAGPCDADGVPMITPGRASARTLNRAALRAKARARKREENVLESVREVIQESTPQGASDNREVMPIAASALQLQPAPVACMKRSYSESVRQGNCEGSAELCLKGCPAAWDFPLSRGEKVRRLLHLFENEMDVSNAATSHAQALCSSASQRVEELEAEVAKLQDRIEELEGQVSERNVDSARSLQPPWSGAAVPGSWGSSSSSENEAASDGEQDCFLFNRQGWRAGADQEEEDSPPKMAHHFDQTSSRDVPSENLLAQLLLSTPSVPMLPRGHLEDATRCLQQRPNGCVTSREHRNLPMAAPRLTSNAPLGVGCLNLGAISSDTPRNVHDKQDLHGGMQSHRITKQLMAALATPRPLPPSAPTKSSGSIAAVRWGGAEKVEWLQFVPREDVQKEAEQVRVWNKWGQEQQIQEFILQEGEYIQVLRGSRGCAEAADGRAADWVVLVTSQLRSKKLGDQRQSSSPTLDVITAPGFEICNVIAGADGRIEGVMRQAL